MRNGLLVSQNVIAVHFISIVLPMGQVYLIVLTISAYIVHTPLDFVLWWTHFQFYVGNVCQPSLLNQATNSNHICEICVTFHLFWNIYQLIYKPKTNWLFFYYFIDGLSNYLHLPLMRLVFSEYNPTVRRPQMVKNFIGKRK